MPTVHLLGTGAALSDPHRNTTMLTVTHGASTIVVDCGGDAVQQILSAGIGLDTISALIVTHEHPDHVAGFPLFMERIWLAGRRRPIPVLGISAAIDQARRCFGAFNTKSWTGLPEIRYVEVAEEDGALALENDDWRITAAPGDHGVPVAGYRFDLKGTNRSMTYSSDTRPSERIAWLARGTDLLIHEATGAGPVHTSPEEAAAIATGAGARKLVLVHLPPGIKDADLADARAVFPETVLGEELATHEF